MIQTNFRKWLEVRELKLGTYPDDIAPIKKGEEFRVYHGFYSIDDAINIALHGTSGKLRASRVYSYESENNPKGLFVTLDREIAQSRFAGGSQPTVMQFTVNEKDLEPPTWPNGKYTVQGEMAPYFYQDPRGSRIARAQTKVSDEEQAKQSKFAALSQSHRPGLAQTLFGSELQALFIGHLNPEDIEQFWIQQKQLDYRRVDDPFVPISREEFLEKFGKNFKYSSNLGDQNSRWRAFKPNDEFSWEGLAKYLKDNFSKKTSTELETYHQFVGASLLGKRDFKDTMKRNRFEDRFKQYLWPKQLPAFHRWIQKMNKQYGEPKYNYEDE